MKSSESGVSVQNDSLVISNWSMEDRDVVAWFNERSSDLSDALEGAIRTGVIALRAAGTGANLDQIGRHFDEMLATFMSVLQSQDPHSPLRTLQESIEKQLSGEVSRLKGDILPALIKIAENIAAEKATEKVKEKTALKGLDFEQEGFQVLSRIAKAHGDIAEFTGGTTGASALSKKGDVTITLCQRDTSGIPVRLAFEFKDRALGLKPIEAELTEALDNRAASAVVGVYAKPELMPGSTSPFYELKDRMFLTFLDKDEPQDSEALAFVYSLARYMAIKAQSNAHGPVNASEVHAQVAEATKLLSSFTTLKTALTQMRKNAIAGTESMERELDQLRAHLQKALADIDQVVEAKAVA